MPTEDRMLLAGLTPFVQAESMAAMDFIVQRHHQASGVVIFTRQSLEMTWAHQWNRVVRIERWLFIAVLPACACSLSSYDLSIFHIFRNNHLFGWSSQNKASRSAFFQVPPLPRILTEMRISASKSCASWSGVIESMVVGSKSAREIGLHDICCADSQTPYTGKTMPCSDCRSCPI